jgi:uncharacterized membrane protein YedE/YeeE
MLESIFNHQHVRDNAYYAKYLIDKPAIDWQMMLVIGLPLGALVSVLLSKSFRVEKVPSLWAWRFGSSRPLRYATAFAGGAIMLFGARLAGGCTSGHGISGGLQLGVGSWVFFASFFIAGILGAFALFGREGRNHV